LTNQRGKPALSSLYSRPDRHTLSYALRMSKKATGLNWSASILEQPAPPVQRLDSVLDDLEMETTQPCCDLTAGLPSTPQAGTKSAEPVQHAFTHQSAHGFAGGASSSETADNLERVSSSEATLQTADTDRKLIAQGHTFGTVLAHWPRQMLDAIMLSCAFLVVIAIRAFVAYPLCGVPVKDINYFALPKRDSCGSGEWIAAAVENSVMAYVSFISCRNCFIDLQADLTVV